jgi:hypothetical protein
VRAPVLPLVFAALGTAACVYGTPPVQFPEPVPEFSSVRVDPGAVTMVWRDGVAADPDLVEACREEIESLLSEAAARRPGSGRAAGTANVRVRVVIIGNRNYLELGPVVFPFVFFGAATGSASITADVTLESSGRTFTGHGEAIEVDGGLYGSPRRRALAVVLDRALARATEAAP